MFLYVNNRLNTLAVNLATYLFHWYSLAVCLRRQTQKIVDDEDALKLKHVLSTDKQLCLPISPPPPQLNVVFFL